MKIFKGVVRLNGNTANHFINVETNNHGTTTFIFTRIIHDLNNDEQQYPIQQDQPATFQQQLRSIDKSYAVTRVDENRYPNFIENMLSEAYPEANQIAINELN